MFNKRRTEASSRAMERRQRENEAPRLKQRISKLSELRLEIEERIGNGPSVASRHIRRIVIEHAPAIFVIPCSESRCNDGGHDLTSEIMRALGSEATEFRGEDPCYGQVGTGSGSCGRVLHYQAHAKYD